MLIPYLWFALLIVLLLSIRKQIPGLVNRVSKVSGAGWDFEFTEESALKTKGSVETGLQPLRATIDRGVEADLRKYSLQQTFGDWLDEHVTTPDPKKYRATIHIPDPLFQNWLYELLDYHPRGGGRGRRFDARAGLIGRVWRTGKTKALRDVNTYNVEQLMEVWSMTRREAAARSVEKYKSMVAIVLTDPGGTRRVGVLYLDSEQADAFGRDVEQMEAAGKYLAEVFRTTIAGNLTEVVTNALGKSPQIALETLT